MADSATDPLAACDNLAQPMGEFLGGAVAVPAFAGGLLAGAEMGPGAIISGVGAGYGAYDGVKDVVTDNWHDVVCQPLHDMNAPQFTVDPAVFADPGASPFSEPYQTPFDQYANDLNVTPVANVTMYDDPAPAVSLGTGDFGGSGSYSGDSGGSGYSDSGGGSSSSDSGGSSSSD